MSGSLRNIPANGATDWTDWVTREQQTEKDFKFCHLTNWDSTSIPQVAAGSRVIVNGALYEFDSNETISGLAAVGNGNEVWFKVVPDGSTCTVEAVTTDGSSWDADKGGYYDSNDLYIGGCYKDGSGNYINKWLYTGRTGVDTEAFKIDNANDKIGIGGYASNNNRDSYFYHASDTYIFWDESESELISHIAGTNEFLITSDKIGIGGYAGGSDRDSYIYLASDCYLFWDESLDCILPSKGTRHTRCGTLNGSATTTQNGWFDALDAYIPTTGDYMVLSGGYYSVALADDIVVAYAYRGSSTTITIYGYRVGGGGAATSETAQNGNGGAFSSTGRISW